LPLRTRAPGRVRANLCGWRLNSRSIPRCRHPPKQRPPFMQSCATPCLPLHRMQHFRGSLLRITNKPTGMGTGPPTSRPPMWFVLHRTFAWGRTDHGERPYPNGQTSPFLANVAYPGPQIQSSISQHAAGICKKLIQLRTTPPPALAGYPAIRRDQDKTPLSCAGKDATMRTCIATTYAGELTPARIECSIQWHHNSLSLRSRGLARSCLS
jgi:hypothetical protein